MVSEILGDRTPAPRESRQRPSPPNCRGGSFTGRRQTAATPHAPPSERTAGDRTEPAGARPPHSCEKLTRLRPAVHTPDGAGIGAGHLPRFSPGFVHVSGSAPGPALAGIRGSRPQLPGTESTPGPTREHRLPQTASRRPRVQSAARHNLSSQNSRECKIWPARLRFACYRQRRGLPQLIAS